MSKCNETIKGQINNENVDHSEFSRDIYCKMYGYK